MALFGSQPALFSCLLGRLVSLLLPTPFLWQSESVGFFLSHTWLISSIPQQLGSNHGNTVTHILFMGKLQCRKVTWFIQNHQASKSRSVSNPRHFDSQSVICLLPCSDLYGFINLYKFLHVIIGPSIISWICLADSIRNVDVGVQRLRKQASNT